MKKVTKKAIRKFVRGKLASDELWACKALVSIYHRQTDDEVNRGQTIYDNGIGFSGSDADILTSFAEFYLEKGYLSPKQKTILFKKMKKYWRQIVELSDQSHLIKLVEQEIS